MQLQEESNQSRYNTTSSAIRNGKLAETASTGFNTTRGCSFRMRRTSSFTNGNVKNKLDIFEANLRELESELTDLRSETKQSKIFA